MMEPAAARTLVDSILTPPSRERVDGALAAFAAAVRERYGDRLVGLYLFGSRARGDHRPDSDADVVLVRNGSTLLLQEVLELSDIATSILADFGLQIHVWPFSQDEWEGREPNERFGRLLAGARVDAKPLPLL